MTASDYAVGHSVKQLAPERLKPGFDRVLVKLHDEWMEGKSSGEHGEKIILSAEAIENKRRPATGTIIAAGSKVEELKVGEHVFLMHFTGYQVPVPDHRRDETGMWIIVAEMECLGYWEEGDLESEDFSEPEQEILFDGEPDDAEAPQGAPESVEATAGARGGTIEDP